MVTTPSPPSELRLPPTPRLGAGYDRYEPYAMRHSARLACQRASRDSTPPPFPAFQAKSPREGSQDEKEALLPPGSIHGSPRKKTSGRSRAFHSLEDDTFGLADPFTLRQPSPQPQSHSELQTTITNGMLPTPAKTPRKKPVNEMGSTARTLFPPSSMSGRPKKSKKHTGFSLDSFNDDSSQNQTQIQIYTDCRDRIPEVDESEDNLFYKPKETRTVQTPADPAPRAPRKTKATETKEKKYRRDKEVDDAVNRDDGMVYVFRGKKMFRKFNEHPESEAEEDDDDLGLFATRPDLANSSLISSVRPLTRSSIKPRVLFPTAKPSIPQQDQPDEVDEEAATDIEDHAKDNDDAVDHEDIEKQERPATPPPKSNDAESSSPDATTSRSLRPRAKRDDADHHETTPMVAEPKKKRVSPFDGWLRKKSAPAAPVTKAKKREAEAVGSPGGPSMKRSRGNRATASST